VNTVTKSELKAILSHEFGHFSQKTMKVGSYVYNVNQVIFNMLYDNESYDDLIQSWADISAYFSYFAFLAIKIIEGIQWILRRLYGVVNKSYMGLSREMEFHADEIAASVTGFEPLKSSLLRMTFADHSFNNVLTFYDGKIAENQKSVNLYKEQWFVMNFLAINNNIPTVTNLPEITVEELNKFNKSKLVIKDQWASHPSTEDRIERLEKSRFTSGQTVNEPANELFRNIEETQKELTNKIFKAVEYQGETSLLPFTEFQREYRKEYLNNTFSKVYNGYYDSKNPLPFEIKNTPQIEEEVTFEELFSDQKVDLVYTAIALQNDIETLKKIADETIQINSFDYDGKKFERNECKELLSKIELELEQVNELIKQNDIRIFQFFRKLEQNQHNTSKLENLYIGFSEFDKEFDAKYEIYASLSNELQFLNYTTPIDQIKANFKKVEPIEASLKEWIKEMMEDIKYQLILSKEIKDNFELYLSKEWEYIGFENFYEENLEILYTAMSNYEFLISKGYFLIKKRLLSYQEGLIKIPQPSLK